MFIKMKKTTPGSRDGRVTEQFLIGQTYDLSNAPELADVFVKTLKVAKFTGATKVKEPIEETEDEVEKSIEEMTGPELKVVAETNNIDITGIKKVGDLRAAVIAGLESEDEEEESEDDGEADGGEEL